MKSILLVVILSTAVIMQAACSGSSSNTGQPDANANAAQASEFDAITDPNAALAEGDRLLDDNQTERAIAAYRQAVKLNPDLAEAHFKLGIAYALIEAEQEKAGVEVATVGNAEGKKAGQAKPLSQAAFEKAAEAYKKLIAANPKDDNAQFNLGRSYNKLNKDEEAEDAFKQAVKLKPDDTEYQTELGAILIKLAKYREAIGPLKKAMEVDPENSRAENLLEDAEAGAKRVDFVGKDANVKNTNANGANANMSSNSNTPPSATNTSVKTPKANVDVRKPEKPSNRPQ